MKKFIELVRGCLSEVREIMPWDLEEMLQEGGAQSDDQLLRLGLLMVEKDQPESAVLVSDWKDLGCGMYNTETESCVQIKSNY